MIDPPPSVVATSLVHRELHVVPVPLAFYLTPLPNNCPPSSTSSASATLTPHASIRSTIPCVPSYVRLPSCPPPSTGRAMIPTPALALVLAVHRAKCRFRRMKRTILKNQVLRRVRLVHRFSRDWMPFEGRVGNTNFNNLSLRTKGYTRSWMHSRPHVRGAGLGRGPLLAWQDMSPGPRSVNPAHLLPLPPPSRGNHNCRKHSRITCLWYIRLSPRLYPRWVHQSACTNKIRHVRTGLRSLVRTDKDQIASSDRGTPRTV